MKLAKIFDEKMNEALEEQKAYDIKSHDKELERDLDFEKKIRAYLFKGDKVRYDEIRANINYGGQ